MGIESVGPAPGMKLRRVETPTVLQLEAVECGAAALGIVLASHGLWEPLESLRTACGVSRDGSKASNILKAARERGMTARGFRKQPLELIDLPLPMIVFWNFNHFLVVEGFGREVVYLNDPAGGRRTVGWEEFDQAFTGVVLVFEATPEFRPGGVRPGVLRALLGRLAGFGNAFAFLALVGLTLVLPGLVLPALSRIFVDEILVGQQRNWLTPLLMGLAVTALVRSALTLLQKHYVLRAETAIAVSSASRLFWKMLRLPVEFYTSRYAGEIGSRMAINDRLAKMIAAELPTMALNITTALFFFAVMLTYDVPLALTSFAFAAANLWLLQSVSVRRKAMNQKLAIDGGKVAGASINGLTLMETLKASGAEGDFFEKWAGYQARWLSSMQQLARSSLLFSALPSALASVEAALLVGIGGLRVMEGAMTLGMLVAFQSLAQSFSGPVRELVALGDRMQQLQGDIDRADDVLRAAPDPGAAMTAPDAKAIGAGRLRGHVELKNVTFGYSRAAPPLLRDFSLAVEPGQRIGLVGASGCGKSTVARLVMGLYEPWTGTILFDGRPRGEWDRDQLAISVAMVDQDIVLFGGTIRDNLTLWDATVPDEAVVSAAQDACIHDAITGRAGTYDAMVEEGGRNFSGGQRQRIEIARALVNNPAILVLDEATSALDPLAEEEIEANLRRRGCTSIVVAHRLSTVRDCDRIYALREGLVVEEGTHDELMRLPDGYYRQLVGSE